MRATLRSRITTRATAAVAVLTLALGLPLTTAPEAVADTGSSASFSSPTDRYAIRDRIVGLTNRVPSGADIRVAMYIFNDLTVARALESAADRGVHVKLVVDHISAQSDTHYAAFKELKDHIGSSTSADSYAVACPANRGCIGAASDGSSINHNKFFLFSRLTDGTSNVVVQSSENLDARGSVGGFGAWNSAVQINGNAALYAGYASYHADLTAMKANNNYYRSVASGNAKAYFFPEASVNPDWPSEPATDAVINRLNGVVCKGNTPGFGTDDGRTVVRVGMNLFSRYEIAKKLHDLDDAGCWVEVAYQLPNGYADAPATDSYKKATSELTAPFNAYNGPVVHTFPESGNGSYPFHSKFLLVKGGYDDGSAQVHDRKILWTGSHNYSFNSLRDSDESFVKLEDTASFDAYENFFRSALPSATCTWTQGDWSRSDCH
ncbi:phospholipase D-like domain-containing protein [Streptomyces sp. NPDC002004]